MIGEWCLYRKYGKNVFFYRIAKYVLLQYRKNAAISNIDKNKHSEMSVCEVLRF